MIKVASIGVVSGGCPQCEKLKAQMAAAFEPHGVILDFIEVGFENDTDYAMKLSEQYGFDDLPSFEVGGVVFQVGFDQATVAKAVKAVNG
jgi:hypothetical protein